MDTTTFHAPGALPDLDSLAALAVANPVFAYAAAVAATAWIASRLVRVAFD